MNLSALSLFGLVLTLVYLTSTFGLAIVYELFASFISLDMGRQREKIQNWLKCNICYIVLLYDSVKCVMLIHSATQHGLNWLFISNSSCSRLLTVSDDGRE